LQDEDLEFLNSVRLDCDVPEEGPAAGSPDCVAEHYKIQRERWASRLTGVAAEEANRAPEQHVALQHDLQTLGFLARTATTDGAYGDVTRAAITAWQTARGRPTTGLIGNDDAQALSAEVTAQTVPHSPAAAASSAADVTQPAGADSIQLTQSHGVYMVPVRINGAITIPFILDSGAGDILVPEDVFKTLIRTRTVTESDFLAPGTYVLADGSQHLEQRFILHELRVGDRVVEDLVANVAPDKADPLLGQSFLGKLPGWAIDNTKQALLIGPGGERKRPQAMPASLPVVARNKSTLESNLGKAQQAIGAVLQEDAGGGLAADRSFCPSANLFDRANDGWEFVTNTQVVPINPDSNAVLIDSGMCEW
jgi:predicted aspartyl protease